jgi:hypothetical protein
MKVKEVNAKKGYVILLDSDKDSHKIKTKDEEWSGLKMAKAPAAKKEEKSDKKGKKGGKK